MRYLLLLLLLPALAHSQAVETCDRAGLAGQTRQDCGGYLGYRAVSSVTDTTLILSCPTVPAPATISGCTAATWKARSTLAGADLLSTCSKTPIPGWGNCGGFEAWTATSIVFGTAPPPPPPPPTVTGEATISWTTSPTCVEGTPSTNCAITAYRLEYGQGGNFPNSVNLGNVLTYKLVIAEGTWQARVIAIAGTVESQPSNAVTFTVTGTSTPIDCVVSDWSAWSTPSWSTCVGGTQSRTETRTRTILTAPANGGAACPSLTESRVVSQACTATKTWKVAATSSGSRPVYEAVLNAAGSATVRGNTEGSVAVGVSCGVEAFKVSTNSYREVAESDITLASPTYKGRRHTAICTLQ